MSRRWGWGKALLLIALASLALSGCIFRYNGYTIDCSGFSISLSYGVPTIDNTGAGAEQVGIRAVDGAGNLLIDQLLPPFPLAGPYPPEGDPVWAMLAGMMAPIPWEHAPQYNPITVTFFNPAGGVLANEVVIGSFRGECPGLPYVGRITGIDDGRLNRLDVAAPVAVYPVYADGGTGLHLYAINAQGQGVLALVVTPEMIAAVPAVPAENTLIAATPDGAIALYRLTTGEFQINVGAYVIVFRDLIPTAEYYHP